jgi:hypothetical protein
VLVGTLADRACQRNPGSAILTVDNQCGRIILLAIYKQDHHLTIAIIGSVVWAGTIGVSQAGYLQIERLHDAKAGAGQLSVDPGQNLIACLIEN